MPGAIVHTLIALICAWAVWHEYQRKDYCYAIFAGNFIPDVLKFGLTAIKQGTLSVFYVDQDNFFRLLSSVTGDVFNWALLGLFFVGLTLCLYHFHVISEKSMYQYDELAQFFLIGVIIHLVLDAFLVEASPWL